MKSLFKPGDILEHTYTVKAADVATFESGLVHEVCSTFALGREMEWASRLFVLKMREEHEEGIGTRLEIEHLSPALVGDQLLIRAEMEALNGNELLCSIAVTTNSGRLVAKGRTGQKIIDRKKIAAIFSSLTSE